MFSLKPLRLGCFITLSSERLGWNVGENKFSRCHTPKAHSDINKTPPIYFPWLHVRSAEATWMSPYVSCMSEKENYLRAGSNLKISKQLFFEILLAPSLAIYLHYPTSFDFSLLARLFVLISAWSFDFEVRHPRCVCSITKNLVYYTYSRTQIFLTY